MASSRQIAAPTSRRKGRGAGWAVFPFPPLLAREEPEAVVVRLPPAEEAERLPPVFFCVVAMCDSFLSGVWYHGADVWCQKPMKTAMRETIPAAQQ